MHLGSFIGVIPEILKRYPVETMRRGDVFIGMTRMPAAALTSRDLLARATPKSTVRAHNAFLTRRAPVGKLSLELDQLRGPPAPFCQLDLRRLRSRSV
jgi:hypothetical protein